MFVKGSLIKIKRAEHFDILKPYMYLLSRRYYRYMFLNFDDALINKFSRLIRISLKLESQKKILTRFSKNLGLG